MISSMRGPMLVDTPEASVKKPAAPFTMMAIETKKPSTTTTSAATPAQWSGRGVRVSMVRFTPSIMIIRKMAMASGVRMSRSQYSAAPAATAAISTRALRATVEVGRAIGAFMPLLSRPRSGASIDVRCWRPPRRCARA